MVGYFEQYNLAAASGLFDRAYYLENNPDVAHQKIDPLAHYIECGARELRNPGPQFDAFFYIEQCRAQGEAPENPLIHYLMLGAHRGLRAHPQDNEQTINRTEDNGSVPKAATKDTTAHIRIDGIEFSSSGVLNITGAIASALEIRRIDIYWNNERIELSKAKHLELEGISQECISVFRFALQGEIGPQEARQHHLRLVLHASTERLDDFFVRMNLVEDFSAGIVKIARIEAEQPINLFVDRPSPSERDRSILCPGDLEIAGWCTADAGIASLTVVVGSTATADVYTGIAREDVRAAFPERDDALRSGFEARVPRRDLPGGEHSVTVRVVDNNGAQRSVAFRVQVPDREDAVDLVQSVYHSETCFRLRTFIDHCETTIGERSPIIEPGAAVHLEQLQSCLRVLKSVSEGFLTAAGAQGAAGHELVADVMRCLGNLPGGILGTDVIATPPADDEKLAAVLQRYRPISFDEHAEPDVSIIIPAYNNFFFTYQCLLSISRHLPRACLQIIVVDDCSVDETVLLSRIVHGARIIRNAENRGFVESCNLGAGAATAPYIMLLNNDTQVTPGAIDALVETLQDTNAGLVGSKLLYPDGRLQEAGGIIWQNGTGWNYGRLEDPDHPYYNYRRPVDYCSGASIMLPRVLWNRLGGFDMRYNPAYFEDVDLAFRVREAGHEVLYQPASVVIHWEGISNGKTPDAGVKASQIRNEPVFRARWAAVLGTRTLRGEQPLLARDRGVERRALFIDATTPTPDQDAGSTVALAHMRILQSLGYKVTFIPAHNFAYMTEYTPALQRIGIEAIHGPAFTRLDRFLAERGSEFDLAYVHRFEVGEEAIPLLRRHAPQARILFNNADLHYLRLERGARLNGSAAELEHAQRVRTRELAVIAAADCTLVCNSREMEILGREVPGAALHYLPWVIEVEARDVPDFAARDGFLFLGGFGHPPNADAVRFFVAEIMPIVRRLLPGVPFHVYGSKLPDELRELAAPDVIIEGFAPDLRAVFDRHRVTIAPLRYGAGFKGKVAMSLAHGVPVVASPIAAEGTGLQDNQQLLVASEPIAFAGALQRLYTDRTLWGRLTAQGLHYVRTHFSEENGERLFSQLLTHWSIENPCRTKIDYPGMALCSRPALGSDTPVSTLISNLKVVP